MFLFMIHFLICNIYLCGIIGMLFLLKHICRKILSPRRQYQIWLLFLCLLAVPFLPFSLKGIWEWVPTLGNNFLFPKTTAAPLSNVGETTDFAVNLANDFAVSVNQDSGPFGDGSWQASGFVGYSLQPSSYAVPICICGHWKSLLCPCKMTIYVNYLSPVCRNAASQKKSLFSVQLFCVLPYWSDFGNREFIFLFPY